MNFMVIGSESSGAVSATPVNRTLNKLTDSQEARSSAYETVYEKTAVGGGTVLREENRKRVAPALQKVSENIAAREDINRTLRQAVSACKTLLETEDSTEQDSLTIELLESLEDLWEQRDVREPNWGDVLNVLQAVLAKADFRSLRKPQINAIKKVLSECLLLGTVEDSDVERSLNLLSESGFDPWIGLSGPSEE
jgi:hypothetical protein